MTVAEAVDRRRRAYKGISVGVFFLCAGMVLLLNTLGVLPYGVWMELARLWPLLVISLGIRLVFFATPLHPLCLLGPALVAGGFALTAASYSGPAAAGVPGESVEVSCPAPPDGATARLDLSFGAGSLKLISEPVASRPGFQGVLRYDGGDPRPDCGGSGALRLGRMTDPARLYLFPSFRGARHRWEAHLASKAPVDLNLKLAAATADLDLRAFVLDDLDVSTAATHLALRLGPPRKRVPVRIDGAAADLAISIPVGTCYTLRRGRVLSLLEADDLRETARHHRRVSSIACGERAAAQSDDAPRYEFTLEMPVSSVVIESEPAGA